MNEQQQRQQQHNSNTDGNVDPRQLLDRVLGTAASVIDGVRTEQLTAPTPCPEMDVRAMIGHLVGVVGRITSLGRGEDPFAVIETPAPDDAWSEEWNAAVGSVRDVWSDDAVLGQPMALPWVQGSGAEVLTSYLSELTVHTWDLAIATGQQPDWDETVIDTSLAASAFLPADNRLAVFEEVAASMGLDEVPIPFAERVAVPDDAAAIDRLIAWYGRDPSR